MTERAESAQHEWAQQLPTLDARVMALVGRLLESSHLIERHWLAPLAAQFDLHSGEFDVLATLRRAGAPHALTPTALYERLMLSSGAMTSRIDRLAHKGLIVRTRAPSDRRSVLVQLTAEGLALIEAILPLHVANEQQALAALSAPEQAQLSELLRKLIDGLGTRPAVGVGVGEPSPKPNTAGHPSGT